MKTAVISTSLNPNSKGAILSQHVAEKLQNDYAEHEILFVDIREYDLNHVFAWELDEKSQRLQETLETCDAFIYGFPVYNYTYWDAFSSFIATIMPKKPHALYGLVVAAWGDMSYLASSVAHQTLMTHNRMIPLPRVLYAGRDYDGDNMNADFADRVNQFCQDFVGIAERLYGA